MGIGKKAQGGLMSLIMTLVVIGMIAGVGLMIFGEMSSALNNSNPPNVSEELITDLGGPLINLFPLIFIVIMIGTVIGVIFSAFSLGSPTSNEDYIFMEGDEIEEIPVEEIEEEGVEYDDDKIQNQKEIVEVSRIKQKGWWGRFSDNLKRN